MHFVWGILVHLLCTENIDLNKCIDKRNVLLEMVRDAAKLSQTFDSDYGADEEKQRYYGGQIIWNEFGVVYNGKNKNTVNVVYFALSMIWRWMSIIEYYTQRY